MAAPRSRSLFVAQALNKTRLHSATVFNGRNILLQILCCGFRFCVRLFDFCLKAALCTIGNSLAVAVAEDRQREAALVTFLTTVSGISFFDIGSAVWGLLFGAAVYVVQARKTA